AIHPSRPTGQNSNIPSSSSSSLTRERSTVGHVRRGLAAMVEEDCGELKVGSPCLSTWGRLKSPGP
ncbi:hypothetical protein M9458_017480, partial [Cirrhinus mrigala]